LVFRVRRIRRNGKLPEPRPFSLVLYLAHPHRLHDAQIVHPNWIRWCPALRPDEDVAIAIVNARRVVPSVPPLLS
jgi:hypothetical protein